MASYSNNEILFSCKYVNSCLPKIFLFAKIIVSVNDTKAYDKKTGLCCMSAPRMFISQAISSNEVIKVALQFNFFRFILKFDIFCL